MATTEPASVSVRAFEATDVPALYALMQGLARFEGYVDQMRVTPQDLITHGLGPNPRFSAFVGHTRGQTEAQGMAVTYLIPWTYDLRPTLVLKELYVDESARGSGLGRALMQAVARQAVALDAPRVNWTVLPDNHPAQAFYRELGAEEDTVWKPWGLDEDAIKQLAAAPSHP